MLNWSSMLGGSAGVATAFLWACSATAWGFAGRRIGAMAVNLLRISLAALILWGCHALIYGHLLPQLPLRVWTLLLISGAIGIGIGDLCYFRSVVIIGPRLGTLMLSLGPIFATVISYFPPLREHLGWQAVVGIGMTVAGVAWVVAAPPGRNSWQIPAGASFAEGLLMGLISSLTASVGMVLSHMAFMPAAGEAPVEAFPTALVRVFAGLAVTFLLAACTRRLPMVAKSFSDRPAMVIVLAGTAVGPVLGMWTSMVALKLNPAGVGVALISTSPIMMVPLAYIFYHERPTVRTIAGTALTVLGIAVLMLR